MSGESPTTLVRRYGTALTVSTLCHALVLLAIASRTLAVRTPEPPPIQVTIREAGSPGSGEGPSAGSASGSAPGEAAAVAEAPSAEAVHDAHVARRDDLDAHARPREVAKIEAPKPRRSPRRAAATSRIALAQRDARRDDERTTRDDPRDEPAARDVEGAEGSVVDSRPRATAAALDHASRADHGGADASPSAAGTEDAGDAGGGGTARGPGRGRRGSGRGGSGGVAGDGDLRAWCASCPSPAYPPRARRQGWQGTVDVTLHVGADGAVEQASVGRSSGFASLDAAAVAVARQSRFNVARGGSLRGLLRYRFVLENARTGTF